MESGRLSVSGGTERVGDKHIRELMKERRLPEEDVENHESWKLGSMGPQRENSILFHRSHNTKCSPSPLSDL
jgi:hypothetical protein